MNNACGEKINIMCSIFIQILKFYQTAHFFIGFMGDPKGQSHASENSTIFMRGTLTRNLSKE